MIDAPARLDDRLAKEARTLIADSVTRSALGGALTGAVLAAAAGVTGQGTTVRLLAAIVPTVAAALAGYWRSRSRWTRAAAADALERRHPADNLVVTAEALTRTASHPWQAVVSAAAWSRIESLAPLSTRAAWARAAVAVGLATAAAMLPWPARAVGTVAGSGASDPAVSVGDARLTSFSVVVSPPAYLGGESVEHRDATAVEVVAGGEVAVRAGTTAATIRVARDGAAPLVAAASGGMAAVTLPEPPDGTWVISAGSAEPGNGARLLIVRVVADAPPLVRIVEPGRDRRLARPLSDLRVAIDARDDHSLRDVRLRVTMVSGSGENLTFADRDVETRVTRAAPGAWTASAVLPLASLDLADGDLVVYRGVAADGRPGAPLVESDAFIVEVGPLREPSDAAGGGEDVDPEQRQAISQQMVIVKTERLETRGPELSPEVRLAEAQGLAIEQRMVRAEFVFLMGGEVQDEIEEAAQAHDLVEGRLANQGQAALLAATRAMSRAEARLTAGDTAAALVAEREALKFLQQAFDRRRYLLRPVAERARIDPSRRLQGPPAPGRSPALPMAGPDLPAGRDALERTASLLARAQRDPGFDLRRPGPGSPPSIRPTPGPPPPPPRWSRVEPRPGSKRWRRHSESYTSPPPGGCRHPWRPHQTTASRAQSPMRSDGGVRELAAPGRVGDRDRGRDRSRDRAQRTSAGDRRRGRRPRPGRRQTPNRSSSASPSGWGRAPWSPGKSHRRTGAGVLVQVSVSRLAMAPQRSAPSPPRRCTSGRSPRRRLRRWWPHRRRPDTWRRWARCRRPLPEGGPVSRELIVEDDGVEVGRLSHTRTSRAIDAEVVVPWWPRRDGVRLVTGARRGCRGTTARVQPPSSPTPRRRRSTCCCGRAGRRGPGPSCAALCRTIRGSPCARPV